jgi:hypothetical protein
MNKAILLFFVLTLFISCSNEKTKTPEEQAHIDKITDSVMKSIENKEPQPLNKVETEWVKVKSWNGSSDKTTEKFTIDNGDWRVIWSYNARKNYNFVVTYSKEGTKLPYDDLLVNLCCNELKGKDTSYVHLSGAFYLGISSSSCSWTVTVEEKREKK